MLDRWVACNAPLIFVSSSLVYSHKPNRNLREFILTSLVLVSTVVAGDIQHHIKCCIILMLTNTYMIVDSVIM
jgi:hypothetical protein